jgi:hypothetical protein
MNKTKFDELTELKNMKKELRQKLFSLKTKKAQQKLSEKLWEINRAINFIYMDEAEHLNNLYRDTIFTGQVHRVTSRGEMYIKTIEFGLIIGDLCNSVNSCTWFNETCCVEYNDGQQISFKVKIDWHPDGISIKPIDMSGGYQNLTKFNELNKNNSLAFVCLKNQETGLLAK